MKMLLILQVFFSIIMLFVKKLFIKEKSNVSFCKGNA